MWFWPWPKREAELDTFRDWLSEDEWQAALEQVRKRPLDFNGRDRRAGDSPRHELIQRCLVRVERRGRVLGMLLVRTRNLSASGACVLHGGRVPRGAKATLVIQAPDGTGVMTTGRIAWCRRAPGEQPRAHEIGIAFDEPIEVGAFVERAGGEPEPASHAA